MRPLLTLLACCLATPALAERPLTYREVLERAVAYNPTVGRADLAREQAQAAVMGANGVYDPSLTVGGNYRRSQQRGFFQGFPFKSNSTSYDLSAGLSQTAPSGTTVSLETTLDRNLSTFETDFGGSTQTEQQQNAWTANTSLRLTQNLLRGFTVAYNMRTVTRARNSLDIADLTLERTRQQILADAASAYWTWVYQDELARIAADSVTTAEEAARIGALQVETGDLAPVERTRLDAALVQAQSQQIEARIAAQQAADAVLLMIGEDPGQDILPATPVDEVLALSLDADAAVEVAIAQNLEVAIAQAELEQARQDHRMARHEMLPSLSATASAGIGNQETTAGAAIGGLFGDQSFPSFTVGGNLQVPLGNRAARAEAQRTSATVLQEELDLQEVQRRVQSEVLLQVSRLGSAQRKVELADLQRRLAAETLAAEEALATAGRSIQKNVLEARTELERTTAEAAKARTDWQIAQVELLRLQGQLEGVSSVF